MSSVLKKLAIVIITKHAFLLYKKSVNPPNNHIQKALFITVFILLIGKLEIRETANKSYFSQVLRVRFKIPLEGLTPELSS